MSKCAFSSFGAYIHGFSCLISEHSCMGSFFPDYLEHYGENMEWWGMVYGKASGPRVLTWGWICSCNTDLKGWTNVIPGVKLARSSNGYYILSWNQIHITWWCCSWEGRWTRGGWTTQLIWGGIGSLPSIVFREMHCAVARSALYYINTIQKPCSPKHCLLSDWAAVICCTGDHPQR